MINNLDRCLGCYLPISKVSYHPNCAKTLFGTTNAPLLETTAKEISRLAQDFINRRLTVTGVQKKLSLTIEGKDLKRFTVVGTLDGGYIMKPPTDEYPEMPAIEDLSMHLATACNIKTASHGLVMMKDGSLAYLTKRFDRKKKKKIAVEDLCQLSRLLTEQKYKSSHEKVAKIIKHYSSNPGDDLLRFFELVLFSFVIGNNDMHLKNFSMITDDPHHITLSPAYDLLAVRLLLRERDDPAELALALNGKRRKFSRMDFISFASNIGINPKVTLMVLDRQINAEQAMRDLIDYSFLSDSLRESFKAVITKNIEKLKKQSR